MKKHTKRAPQSLACSGKQKYTREEAEAMALYRASQDGSLMDAYRCPYGCQLYGGEPAWHIGHRILRKHG